MSRQAQTTDLPPECATWCLELIPQRYSTPSESLSVDHVPGRLAEVY